MFLNRNDESIRGTYCNLDVILDIKIMDFEVKGLFFEFT